MSRPAGLLRMQFDADGDLAEAARACEADALLRRYGLTRHVLDAEFADFEDNSAFVTITDDDGVVLAAARYVVPGPHGLKSLGELNRDPWRVDGHERARAAGLDLASTWDVATISRRPGAGSELRMAAALCHGLILAARQNHVTATVAILNETVRRLLAAIGLMFEVLPGTATAPFDGSPASTPVYAPFGWQMDMARRVNPDGYRLAVLGVGLDGMVVPPLADFRLQRSRRLIDLTATEVSFTSDDLLGVGQ